MAVCHRDTETLTYRTIRDGNTTPGFEVLACASLDQHNFISNTPFCILDVWQSLIRVVVLHLLSRGKKISTATNTAEILHKTDLSV